MIKKGAISEVKKFIKLKVPKAKAHKSYWDNEIKEYLDKKIEIDELLKKYQ